MNKSISKVTTQWKPCPDGGWGREEKRGSCHTIIPNAFRSFPPCVETPMSKYLALLNEKIESQIGDGKDEARYHTIAKG